MIRILGTVFAGLLGLAFGSFLNVCLSRWPEGESIVKPASHCRNCARTLAWWENVPLVSWLALRGRCRGCGAWIGWRYPLVELLIGALWAWQVWQLLPWVLGMPIPPIVLALHVAEGVEPMIFFWLLVALAILDAENLWLPNWLTLPGIALGFVSTLLNALLLFQNPNKDIAGLGPLGIAGGSLLSALLAAALILLIRWVYWLIRKQEGIGLGDAKLMAMLGAWLGLSGALLSFGVGVTLGAAVAVVVLIQGRRDGKSVGLTKLPLGTFLCVGGFVSSLWGPQIIGAYMRWAGF